MDDRDPKALKRTRGGRERLLNVAAELFNTNGLSATSLQMIADRLGVTKPALYHHFRSRDDIVRALMKPVVEDAGEATRRFDELPARDRPAAARTFYTDFVITHRQVIHMVFFDRKAMPGSLPDTVDTLADRVSQALAGSDDPRAVAAGFTLVYGIAALVARRPDLDDAEMRGLVTGIFETLTQLPG
ncbi:MAG: TetR/AcrR family transcriptional regulator [Propionicimonas sp.]|uniref:TetR/AcrR family transcriptional regulator n=1 Tax=Propionicimonas sp. TaxID=1955623 RepID=UPI002B21A8D2|nr:TetR/AcrR family transcriptional regulator [Propionicimonas sp.]MEA4944790.1 TetR/AcrR family transcriptional regulator [Propionicimonas sp.]MEA5052434.1 TetR/AcrR family transcriptional regulator [Propionicimonas sp.]MEA5117157.1 TetR/AcrR family transcriptional regulator [Propionicimonas sp.]